MVQKLITPAEIKSIYKPRPRNTNKGNFGHALIIAGNPGKMGAAVISSRACARTGAGLTTVACDPSLFSIIHHSCPEVMCASREEILLAKKYTALLIGPGMGTSGTETDLLEQLLNKVEFPFVLDADAISILAANPEMQAKIPPASVLTPHVKEFDRLFGEHHSHNDRIVRASQFTRTNKLVVVLKDFETTIIQGEEIYINRETGNQGLAKGGSGDALAGMIVSLMAQGYTGLNASILGVYLHGLAANISLKNQSFESMLITDVIENIGAAFKEIVAY